MKLVFIIVEKGSGVGGVWRDNRYPGCGCDSMLPEDLDVLRPPNLPQRAYYRRCLANLIVNFGLVELSICRSLNP
jgi:hypothetical protein